MTLSVIIPVLDEAENLPRLYRELADVAAAEPWELQVIFVDDGSTDGSWEVIERLAAEDSRVLGIRFRRNFGKAAALTAGFHAAEGEQIVTMDGDLQDDPAEVPRLLAKLDEGFDVVSGWKQVRHDPWDKVIPSRVFNWLVSKLTGVVLHDHNCGLKCFRREVMNELRLYGELHRFVPVLAAARGYRVTEAVVKHRPRTYGRSKYGVSRIVTGLLDLLTVKFVIGYGQRPQHLMGTIGLGSFALGGLGMLYLAVRWCLSRLVDGMTPIHLHETAALYYSLALIMIGAQFMSFGFLGEMITAYLVRESDTYSIREHTSPGRTAPAAPASNASEAT